MSADVFVDTNVLLYTIDVHLRFQLSYWDAAILAAAKRVGCHTVFSEDMNDGQNYDGVTVVNPFTVATP